MFISHFLTFTLSFIAIILSGSAGTAVITTDKALLFTDGRYHNQAEIELGSEWTLMKQGDLCSICSYINVPWRNEIWCHIICSSARAAVCVAVIRYWTCGEEREEWVVWWHHRHSYLDIQSYYRHYFTDVDVLTAYCCLHYLHSLYYH